MNELDDVLKEMLILNVILGKNFHIYVILSEV